jgi:hypothetical protein
MWFILAFMFCVSTMMAQTLVNGFMQGAGASVVAVSEFSERYDRYYVDRNQVTNPQLGEIHTQGVALYLSTGLTDWLDVVANVPYVWVRSNAGLFSGDAAFQDFSGGIKVRPIHTNILDGQLSVVLAGIGTTPMQDYINDSPVAIGHQASGIDGRAVVQYKANSGVFIEAQWGYLARGRVLVDRGFDVDVPNNIEIVMKAGWGTSDWFADVWVQNQIAQSGTNIGPGVAFPSNAQSFTRVGGTLVYNLGSNLRIVGGGMATIFGRNVGHTLRSSVGIVYQLPSWQGLSL